MATRSDFAQKLLSDLRMRKERMAASSQSSRHSTGMAADVYGNPSQNYKGSRQIKALESVGSRPSTSQRRSNSLNFEETSKQLVPFKGGRNAGQIGDLSMALAFALENRGKLTKLESSGNNSMLSFLNHIGRRSLDLGKMERRSSFDVNQSSSRIPTLSYLQINEISKGAQKLNQILRACSNGLNFDKYSIEIGRELLKGAMDLEESLRMLVNLQEASEYTITPQRKNRITLLDEDEDDEDNTVKIAENKQVDRPRFSFDKPSRNSHKIKEVTKTDFKQSLKALTYPTEDPNFSRKQAVNTSHLVPHKRSASCSPDFRGLVPFTESKHHRSSSESKPGKKRVSNVIAKLMGLEELPQNADSKSKLKESSSKQKEGMVSKNIAHASTKNAEIKAGDIENQAPLAIEKKLIQTNIQVPRDIQVTRSANYEVMVPDGKLLWKDLGREDSINPVSGSRKASVAIDKQQRDKGQLYQFTGVQNFQERVRRQDNTKHKEQIGMERGETKQPVLKEDVQKHRTLEAAKMSQEKIGGKESTLQKEKRNANRLPPNNQQKPQYDHGMHQKQVLKKSELQEEKREQQHVKQKFQVRKQRGNEAEPKNPSKPMHDATDLQRKQQYMNQTVQNKRSSTAFIDERLLKGLPNGKNQEDLVRDGSSANLKINTRNSINGSSDQNVLPRELGSETDNTKRSIPPVTEEKPVHVSAMRRKVDRMKVHTSETPRKIDEAITRRNGTRHNSARPLKHQISILQEMKQRKIERTSGSKGEEQMRGSRSKEAEVRSFRPEIAEESIILPNGALTSNKEAEHTPTLHSFGEDESQSPSITYFPTSYESCQDTASELSTVQAPVFSDGQQLKSQKPVSSSLNDVAGANGGSIEISCLTQHEHKELSTPRMQDLLTDNETHLKQILIKSQLFLNTAEALFKLNIPIGILDVTDYNSQDEDCKIILDCGYEIMKRKGRRQELTLHNISIMSTKAMSLDNLVKQLYKDLEKLKFYGRNGSDEYDAADYLLKMLETDVQNRDPDVNSMWDLGWNEVKFSILEKDDLIRDVERYLLNVLIDEIMKDLLHLSVLI
ncbi:hypothetical protein CsSME_00013694 [Camellia sinensis var. sinensis]